MGSGGVGGIEFNGPFILALGSCEVMFVIIFLVGQRNMRVSERVIDVQSLESGGLRFWHRLIRWHCARCIGSAQKIVSVSQTTVSKGEVWIFFYRLLVVFN